jgi:hypothetical protein
VFDPERTSHNFPVKAFEAVQDETYVLLVLISALGPVTNRRINPNVMLSTMAENNINAQIVLSRHRSQTSSEQSYGKFMAIFGAQRFSTVLPNTSLRMHS